MKKILIATLPILALIGCGEAISFETEGSYTISWGIIGVLAGLALAGATYCACLAIHQLYRLT